MNWIVSLDVIVLALMLACVVVVVTRASCRYQIARRVKKIDSESRRKLAAVLSIQVGILKAIASSAPYLGLVGTCVGIMSATVFGGAMEKNTFLAKLGARMAATLITTAAGILVAVSATCSYNYLCTRKELLESEVSNDPPAQIGRYRQVAGRFPLTKRFSQLPAFALIAAPGLAILVAVYTPYFAPREPTGFGVELASARCEYDGDDRLIILRITDAGKLFFNTEQEDWNGVAGRLSEIYGMRVHRTLYLVADDAVPFQTVADAIDIVQNTDNLNINLKLVTPKALKAHCPEPVLIGASQRALR